MSQETRENIGANGAGILSNAGIEDTDGHKDRLRAVNATPYPTGAVIRVSITSPTEFSQTLLASATAEDLKGIEEDLRAGMKRAETSGGPKLIETRPVRIERLNGKLALVIPYVRAGVGVETSPWLATMYKISVDKGLIEFTLSQRQSDAFMWGPILERVKRSLTFSAAMVSAKPPAKTWYSFDPLELGESDCVQTSADPIQDTWRRYGKGNTHMEKYGTIKEKIAYVTMSANGGKANRAYFDSLLVCRDSRRFVLERLSKESTKSN